jgi:uncharacterized protein YndB with AHSA1/START domain
MALLQLALIVSAKRELTFSADEVPAGSSGPGGLKVVREKFDTLEGPAWRQVGVTTVSPSFMVGAEIEDLDDPGASLSLAWYLPGEEEAGEARPAEAAKAGLIAEPLARPRASAGLEWWYKLESRGPVSETLFFNCGFQPPFKPSDITIYLTDLKNFGVPSYIISKVMYGHKTASYTEADWGFTQIVSEGRLAG